MKFNSLDELAAHLEKSLLIYRQNIERGMERSARQIEKTAKEMIGHYQDETGPYPAWDQLADATEYQKAKQGYPVDAPLLRTGEMREAITHESAGFEAIIGVKGEGAGQILKYHEFGTLHIPPRPVLGPAGFKSETYIKKTIGQAVMTSLFEGTPIPLDGDSE